MIFLLWHVKELAKICIYTFKVVWKDLRNCVIFPIAIVLNQRQETE